MVAPLYISEISPPEIRGTLLVLQELCIVVGIVIAFYITYGTRHIAGHWAWRLPFLIQMLPAVVMCAGVFMLPYSPRWLCQRGRVEESLQTLAKIRQLPTTDERVLEEWNEIRAECAYRAELSTEKHPVLSQPGTWNAIKLQISLYVDCWKMPIYKRTQVAVGLMFFQQFVGINALIVSIFPHLKILGLLWLTQIVLLTNAFQDHGPRLRNATDPVWCDEHLPGRWLYLVSMGYGWIRSSQASPMGFGVHVHLPLRYRCFGRQVRWTMAYP